jgi:predicted permease
MSALTDLRYSARSFMRSPGLTLALLFTIALGIGSNASVYGFVRGLVARDIPLPAADRVVSLFARDAQLSTGLVSYQDFQSLKNDDAFEWVGAAHESQGSIVLSDRSAIMSVAAVTPELADLFNLSLDEGVVISHRAWQLEFGSKAQVSGEPIRIDAVATHVSGVAPEWLEGVYRDRPVDIWMPLGEQTLQGVEPGRRSLWILARLRDGVSSDQAQAAVDRRVSGVGGWPRHGIIGAQAAVDARRTSADQIGVLRYTGMTPEIAAGLSRVGTLLRVAAAAVFLIACANVASFLLGRASARSHEISVRIALGASRAQLVRQLLSDNVLMSVTGGALGVLLAVWTSQIVPALFFDQDAEQLAFAPDVFAIVVASAACCAIMIICGLIPLLEIRHDRPAAVLQRESASPSSAGRHLRSGLVVAQMTACCVLVICTGLLLHGLRTALETTVGRRMGEPILATVHARHDSVLTYFRDVERAAQSVAGISGLAWAGKAPGSSPTWQSLHIEPANVPLREVTMDVVAFTRDSLPLIVLPPIAGRMFGGRDTAQTCRVAIVNEEAAEELFDGNAAGRSIEDAAGARVEIIGVLATRRAEHAAVRNRPTIYYYAAQTGTTLDHTGPARFRVPTGPTTATAVLDANIVSARYFEAVGLSPIAGRVFPEEPATGVCRVAVINQEAAEQYFDGNAVGAAVIDSAGRRTEIIGVVRSALLGTFQRPAEPAIYFPMVQDTPHGMTLILGARDTNRQMVAEVRRRVEAVPGRGLLPPVVKTLDEHMSQTALAPLRIATVLVGASATTALTLGVLGLYGALTDSARRRRREVALRIALGAQGWRLIRQVLEEGGRLAGAGGLAGMLGSLLAARLLGGITPIDSSITGWVWLTAPLVLATAVGIASVLPVRRALMVNPVTIMRDT